MLLLIIVAELDIFEIVIFIHHDISLQSFVKYNRVYIPIWQIYYEALISLVSRRNWYPMSNEWEISPLVIK